MPVSPAVMCLVRTLCVPPGAGSSVSPLTLGLGHVHSMRWCPQRT
jgi:hypothetical protein